MATQVTECFLIEDEDLEKQIDAVSDAIDKSGLTNQDVIDHQFIQINRLLKTIDKQAKMLAEQAAQHEQVVNHLAKLYQTNTIVN